MTIVSIHDINLSLRYATNFILLKDKRIYQYGNKDILTSQTLSDIYSVEVKVYHLDGNIFVVPIKQIDSPKSNQSAGEENEK